MQGIEGDFGDFLMELDDLVDSVETGHDTKKSSLVADTPGSDAEEDEEEEAGDGLEPSDEEEEEGEEEASSEERSDDDRNESDEEEEADEEESEGEREEDDEKEKELEKHTYRPAKGEDIYGRIVDPAVASAAKYVPPSKRFAQVKSSSHNSYG